MTQKISIAYSPDTDDAFMVEGLICGAISSSIYTFDFVSDDIQKLNEEAATEKYDITAISIGAYPFLADKYLLLDSGASIGENYGPKLVVAQDSHLELTDFLNLTKRIAVPGLQTSAYFSGFDLLNGFVAVPMRFDRIAEAVKAGTVEAGILIHELQLNPESDGLRSLGDLGILWNEKYSKPLPLGGNAIRRGLGHNHIERLSQLYLDSINWGLKNRETTIKTALKKTGKDLSDHAANRYISMYVSDQTVHMSSDVRDSIAILLGNAHKNGLCPSIQNKMFAESTAHCYP